MRLDPAFRNSSLHFIAQALFQLGRHAEAAGRLRERLVLNPQSDSSRLLLAAALGHLGQGEAACQVWRELLAIDPAFSLERRRRVLPFRDPAEFERIVDGLRQAGLPEPA